MAVGARGMVGARRGHDAPSEGHLRIDTCGGWTRVLVDPECYGRVTNSDRVTRESSVTPPGAPDTVSLMEPVIAQVLAANQAFYDAHEARDLDAMRAVWEHSDHVVCVHPGWPILRTWPHVEESWRRIFAGPGRNQFILTNEAVAVHGDTAWVTLDENLVDSGGTGTVAATNLFVRRDERWLLVAHHGSPVIAS